MTQPQPKPRGQKPKITTGEAVERMITVRLPSQVHGEVAKLCGCIGVSINAYVLRLIVADLERRRVDRTKAGDGK